MLISLVGIEKIVPTFGDLEVFLQLLARSATGERMNPYNSIWTGVTPGDGPEEFHVVLLDNGRTSVLADQESRATLACIRCGACLNICPVYRQTGGPRLRLDLRRADRRHPDAAVAGDAAFALAALRLDALWRLLRRLSGQDRYPGDSASPAQQSGGGGAAARRAAGDEGGGLVLCRWRAPRIGAETGAHRAEAFVEDGAIGRLPGMLAGWTRFRDLPQVPAESFRQWWAKRQRKEMP